MHGSHKLSGTSRGTSPRINNSPLFHFFPMWVLPESVRGFFNYIELVTGWRDRPSWTVRPTTQENLGQSFVWVQWTPASTSITFFLRGENYFRGMIGMTCKSLILQNFVCFITKYAKKPTWSAVATALLFNIFETSMTFIFHFNFLISLMIPCQKSAFGRKTEHIGWLAVNLFLIPTGVQTFPKTITVFQL